MELPRLLDGRLKLRHVVLVDALTEHRSIVAACGAAGSGKADAMTRVYVQDVTLRDGMHASGIVTTPPRSPRSPPRSTAPASPRSR
jgi:hypothetical protein